MLGRFGLQRSIVRFPANLASWDGSDEHPEVKACSEAGAY
jgi:hypothetical protein